MSATGELEIIAHFVDKAQKGIDQTDSETPFSPTAQPATAPSKDGRKTSDDMQVIGHKNRLGDCIYRIRRGGIIHLG